MLAQIAERAGLSKATLFRHFSDKREVLFQGQASSATLVAAAVESSPESAPVTDALRAALRALCDTHVPEQRQIGRQIEALVRSHPDLQERAQHKRVTIAAALEGALERRTPDRRLAEVLADLGIRAYYQGFTRWTDTRGDEDLAPM
jgi:AcrR family transcriptional regulator